MLCLQVKTWFQNRRMKWKKQVAEGDNKPDKKRSCPFPSNNINVS